MAISASARKWASALGVISVCCASTVALQGCSSSPDESPSSSSTTSSATRSSSVRSSPTGVSSPSQASSTSGSASPNREERAFQLTTSDGVKTVSGHGISMTVPSDWGTYENEFQGLAGTTWEWAVGLPAETKPFPSGLQFSAGIPGRGGQLSTGLNKAAKKLAELAPGYRFIDEGSVNVEGAAAAKFIRFERIQEYQGQKTLLEQVSLFIQVADDVTTTVRFLAPAGQWKAMMDTACTSIKVTT